MNKDYPINYKIIGEGEPLIILHGLFGSLDNWKTFSRQLMKDFQVILVDQRNHGRSFWDDDFDYPILSNDLGDLMDHLNISEAHLLGHSMGGKVVQQFANDFQSRVKSAISVDIGYKKYAPSHNYIFNQILKMDVTSISSRQEADDYLMGTIPELSVRQFLLKSLTRNSEGGFRWKTNFAALHNNYDNILSQVEISMIEVPILFIRGTISPYISEKDKSEIIEDIPGAQISEISAGHWIHAEKPKELYDVVKGFLSRS